MSVKLLTEHPLTFLSLNGGYTGSSESTLSNCWTNMSRLICSFAFMSASLFVFVLRSVGIGDVGCVVIMAFLGPEVIQLFSCSTQLSTKFQLLIKTKIPTNKEVSIFKSVTQMLYLSCQQLFAF